jgi:hypothetical protein
MVGFAEFEAPTATAPKSSKNGSAVLALGETTGVGRVEGTGLPGLVVKKCGSVEGSIGNAGRETDGCAS